MRVRLSNQLYSYPVTYYKRATRPETFEMNIIGIKPLIAAIAA
jgi:hypothetical protein